MTIATRPETRPMTPPDDALRASLDDFEALCAREIAPRAVGVDRAGAVPPRHREMLRDAGYLRLFHAPEVGGTGADGAALARAMEALAGACASTFWEATISSLLCGRMLHALCAPHHHARWLRPIVAGDKVGAFAASEDAAGSDPGSYRTTLRRGASGPRLSGVKSRISNASTADVAVVLARDGDPTGPALCYVVVDLRAAGVTRREQPKLGLRGMSWGAIEFDDVAVPPGDVIAGADIAKTLQVVEWGQVLQAWCGVGIAARALAEAASYARRREAFGRPIAHLPAVHGRLAEVSAEVDAARLLAADATARKAAGLAARDEVMMAKVYATEAAVRAADAAMRTLGGWGYALEHPAERLYRDALANVPAGLPNDRLRELLACGMVGADPWRYGAFDGLTAAGLRG